MLKDYIDQYLDNETFFRNTYGPLTYFSKLAVYHKDGGLLPVAPWGEFGGEPLVLPHPDFVQHLTVTVLDKNRQMKTELLDLGATLKKLAALYPVDFKEIPVKHSVVRIEQSAESRALLERLLLSKPG